MVKWVVWRGVARNGREKTTIVRFELCEPQDFANDKRQNIDD
jgi:tRNA G37 N-methylase TrmD